MRALHTPSVVAVAGVVLALIGCSDDGGAAGERAGASDPVPGRSHDDTSDSDHAVEGDPIEGDLEVGRDVTPPGTALAVGEPAIVPYRSPDGRVEALLAVMVVRIAEGDPADVDHVDVGDRASGAIPYYVTLSITKVSGDNLAGRPLEPGFTIQLLDGSRAALPILQFDPFEPCQWVAAPARIDRSGDFLTCDPYTIPETAAVSGYAFVGEIGGPYHEAPIVWTERVGAR